MAPAAVPAASEGATQVAPESRAFLVVEPASKAKDAAVVRAPARLAFRDGAVAEVAAPIEGRVAEIHVKVGDKVKAGDPLVTLTSPAAAAARADLESSAAARNAARALVERQTGMFQRGVGIESEKLQAELDLAKSQAELARAQRAAAYLGAGSGSTVVVRAPIDGTVLARRTTVGQVAQPGGEAMIEIGDPSALWVVADVFERDLPLLGVGDGASVELTATTKAVRGHVVSVGAALSGGLRTAPVYIALDGEGLSLKPGMYARATIEAQTIEGVTVPVTAVLIKDGKKSIVYVEKDDKTFSPREVTVGQPIDGRVQVLSGLEPGERVVMRGALLVDGSAEQLL